jgi:hypothetical protein
MIVANTAEEVKKSIERDKRDVFNARLDWVLDASPDP